MANFKSVPFGLLTSVNSGAYDQTKTNIAGQVASRTVNSNTILSPPPIKWLDIFTDSGEIASEVDYTPNGRAFFLTAITAGLARLVLYNFNATTGVFNYVGKVQLTFPNLAATTHTLHGLKVDDSNTSNIKAFVVTTGTVAINGGLFMVPNLVLGDFVPSGFATLPFGTGSAQKATYFLQDPANIGAGQLNIAGGGVLLDRTNSIAYVHNGVSATHQYYLYDYSLTPNVPSITCTTPIATPGVVNATAHGYVAGDQVQFTGVGLPTGITAGTVYFVIAAGLTANAFEISLTTGGAAINFTGSSTGTQTVSRGFGISSSNWKWKTGNLPALTGTLLLNNSEVSATPAHTTNSGSLCAAFGTTTNLYLGKLSDLTSGQTLWPTLVTANLLGSANQIVAPVAVTVDYDDTFDRFVYTTSVAKFIAKQCVNSVIQNIYGCLNNDYLEGVSQTDLYTAFGAITVSDVRVKNGWHFVLGGSTGQRGTIAMNHGADTRGDASYIITPVITLPANSTLNAITFTRQFRTLTSEPVVFYRLSGFGSATGGWIALSSDLGFPSNTSVGSSGQIQLKAEFSMTGAMNSQPYFPQEVYVRHTPPVLMSDNWAFDEDSTTVGTNSPSYVGFTMITAYSNPSTVPQLFLRGYSPSTNNQIVGTLDTVTNSSSVTYSTDSGTSWNALGTIPNTVGTKIRFLIASPPSGTAVMSLRES